MAEAVMTTKVLLKRKNKAPDTRINIILDAISRRYTQRDASKLAGISEDTLSLWKKDSEFSEQMEQRLAIAVALLHEPKLLILDEPTNGLDPNGILEMRLLLQKLNSELGITILISSHILSEIEKLVTHIGIIHKGELLMQGTLQELMNKQQLSNFIVLDTSSNEKAFSILSLNIADLQINNNKIILPFLEKSKIAEINQLLVKQKIDVYEISPEKNDLENIFMQLINKN